MLRDTSITILAPLAMSLALHAGCFTLMNYYYGAAPSGGPSVAKRQAPLRVIFHSAQPVSAGNDLSTTGPDNGGGSPTPPLPEGLASLPGPYYFPPGELSRKPQVAEEIPLDYPDNAPLVARKHMVLRLLINETGRVDKVIVETTDVPAELEALARQAFAQAKFQPGLRGEAPVKSQMLVEITFESGSVPPPTGTMLPAR